MSLSEMKREQNTNSMCCVTRKKSGAASQRPVASTASAPLKRVTGWFGEEEVENLKRSVERATPSADQDRSRGEQRSTTFRPQ